MQRISKPKSIQDIPTVDEIQELLQATEKLRYRFAREIAWLREEESEVDSETAIEYLKQYEAEWVAGTYSIETVLREICEDFPGFVLPAVLQMLVDVKAKGE